MSQDSPRPPSAATADATKDAAGLTPARQIVSALLGLVATLLAMDTLRLFAGEQWLAPLMPLETHFYFALAATLLPLVFLLFPTPAPSRSRSGWMIGLDIVLALAAFVVCVYLASSATRILDEGWEFGAPPLPTAAAAALWFLLLVAVRRAVGMALALIAATFSFLPLFAASLPGPFAGLSSNFADTAAYHAMSIESVFGLPFRAFADLVIGFLVFGVALQHTGGGRFFLDLAFALLGHVRGGPAKVSILASGLMGSMSGSVVTNVVTTGQMTIPAMKRAGLSPERAAAVEACASTGGVLLPPIMGSTAFVMASFLDVPYLQVAAGAAIPALLYFLILFLQLDARAGRGAERGVAREELPRLVPTLRAGWYYIGAFAALILLLLVLQREAHAPYYATAALLILNQFSPRYRWNGRRALDFLAASGRLLAELFAVLAGVGLIVGALSITGLSGTLVNDLLFLAGDSTLALLAMGAAASFVLGIGMTVTAAYIFLAIVLAPALGQAGLEPLAVHLFILYWAMLSFITPPVALGAFAAASVADARPIATGFAALRLGGIIYFLPFVFVFQPALLLQGDLTGIAAAVAGAIGACYLLSAAFEGYAPLTARSLGRPARALSAVAGLLLGLLTAGAL
ncbi:MAG: TRAP transporter fused permease subunit [Pseudomonadota bacterium]